MNEVQDAVIVGAGIVGVSTSLNLLASGMNVLLVDAHEPGSQTSFGNTGVIETSYVLPFGAPNLGRLLRIALDRDTSVRIHYPTLTKYLPWLVETFAQSQPRPRKTSGRLLRPLTEIALDEHVQLMRSTSAEQYLTRAGKVQLFLSEASFRASQLERTVAREVGVPFEVFDTSEFREIEPHLCPVFLKAVRWSATARVTDPEAVTKAYAKRFIQEGGRFLGAQVVSLRPRTPDGWWVDLGNSGVAARQVVVCAGPWSSRLLRPLGYDFPLGVRRGYHRHFSVQGDAALSHVIVDSDFGYLIAPMTKGYRLTTGIEFTSLEAPPRPERISSLAQRARVLFPLGEPLEPTTWFGDRPCFPDSLPVIGPAFRHAGLWLNIGHGHLGLTIGPPSGRLLAEMMTGRTTFCDPQPYRADRFTA